MCISKDSQIKNNESLELKKNVQFKGHNGHNQENADSRCDSGTSVILALGKRRDEFSVNLHWQSMSDYMVTSRLP